MPDAALFQQLNRLFAAPQEVHAYFASRSSDSFLLPHSDPAVTQRALNDVDRHYTSRLLAQADAIRHGQIKLLGTTFPDTGTARAWHTDPVSDHTWPLLTRDRMDAYLWADTPPADTKLVWELNRHQYLLQLALAAYLTGDATYTYPVAAHLRVWMTANPIYHGINWYSSLEIGVRLIAWTLIFQFMRDSPAFDHTSMMAFLKGIYMQTDFLLHHLTTDEAVPNNHLIGEAAALAIVGAVFPEFKAAKRWRAAGMHHLKEQALAQTFNDGLNREQATGYHRFVGEFLILVKQATSRGLLRSSHVIDGVLERMFDATAALIAPDGTVPVWGDSDDGSAHGLSETNRYWDFRPFLAVGAVMFGRPDWKHISGSLRADGIWLMGMVGLKTWQTLDDSPPAYTARAFEQAGVYVLRSHRGVGADMGVIRAGPFGLGRNGPCSHAHCDLLSVQLWIGGHALFVDAGTFTYHGDLRNEFRKTAAHNTLMIDNHEQALPGDLFSWQTIPQAQVIEWQPPEQITASMPVGDVRHERRLTLVERGHWQITDTVYPSGRHTLLWRFHLAPGLTIQHSTKAPGEWLVMDRHHYRVRILPPEGVAVCCEQGWVSRHYRQRTRNTVLTGHFVLTSTYPVVFTWDIRNRSNNGNTGVQRREKR